MLVSLPFMTAAPKLRTWATMFVSSGATLFVPVGHAPAYLAIDLISGALVLMRPAGLPQRAIGLLFAFMCMFDLGFILSGHPERMDTYISANVLIGWLQWAILLAWGAYGVRQYLARRHGAVRGPIPAGKRVR
jgi:hypothetical protein